MKKIIILLIMAIAFAFAGSSCAGPKMNTKTGLYGKSNNKNSYSSVPPWCKNTKTKKRK